MLNRVVCLLPLVPHSKSLGHIVFNLDYLKVILTVCFFLGCVNQCRYRTNGKRCATRRTGVCVFELSSFPSWQRSELMLT